MSKESKQVSAITGHHCAEKRLESALLAKRIAKFLKTGGTVKVISNEAPIKQQLIHGTRHAYVITMCRCGPCTSWANKNRVAKGAVA